jgi:hypothetical protein
VPIDSILVAAAVLTTFLIFEAFYFGVISIRARLASSLVPLTNDAAASDYRGGRVVIRLSHRELPPTATERPDCVCFFNSSHRNHHLTRR